MFSAIKKLTSSPSSNANGIANSGGGNGGGGGGGSLNGNSSFHTMSSSLQKKFARGTRTCL